MTDREAWHFRRLWPLGIIGLGIGLFLWLGGTHWLSFDVLQRQQHSLRDLVAAHYWPAVAAYICLYVAIVALSVPGAAALTLAGGLLFGAVPATCYIVVAATGGAVILFLAARSAIGEPLRARAGPWMTKLVAGFQRDAWSYMLVLRLLPLFPFFVVNLVPAFLGVSLRCFAATTFVGIIPATYVYALIGAGLGQSIGTGAGLPGLLSPSVVAGLAGLAALSAAPIAYKRFFSQRPSDHD